jgi:hypothetical protein
MHARYLIPALMCLASTIHAQAANQAILTWNPVTADTDGNPVTGVQYNVWQGLRGAAKSKATTTSAVTLTIGSGLSSGSAYCWQVSAFTATNPESALSAEACKQFPPAPAASPSALTVQ